MAFKSYKKEDIPAGYKKIFSESDNKARLIVSVNEGKLAVILDCNSRKINCIL